jgi:hypothetical protein
MLTAIPRPALSIGLAGTVPFVVGALGSWTLPGDIADAMRQATLAYAAITLSFVGAAHWGMALARAADGRSEEISFQRLGWSAAPAIVGWVAQFMIPFPALIMLILAFWIAFLVDVRAVAAGLFPRWYLKLRRLLTALVVLSLGVIVPTSWG